MRKCFLAFWVHFSPFPFCVAQTKKINTKKFWPTLAKNVVTLNVTETRSYIQTSMYLHPCIYIGTFIHLWTYVGTFIHLYMNVPTFLHICTNVNVRTFWVIVYYPSQLLAQIKYRYFWCFWSFRFQSFDQPFPIKPIDRKNCQTCLTSLLVRLPDHNSFRLSHHYRKAILKILKDQCDQMVILFFHYLVIYNNDNSSNRIKLLPKLVQNFAKVAKFRQIWSHWVGKTFVEICLIG